MKRPTKLPRGVRLEVEGPAGQRVPAWVERCTRTVFALCGPVGMSVPVLVLIEGAEVRRSVHHLIEKLSRWGYRRIRVHLAEGDDREVPVFCPQATQLRSVYSDPKL